MRVTCFAALDRGLPRVYTAAIPLDGLHHVARALLEVLRLLVEQILVRHHALLDMSQWKAVVMRAIIN